MKKKYIRQKYANYQLLAIDEDGKDEVDSFRIPSACICHHNRANSDIFGSDFGLRNGLTSSPNLPNCKTRGPGRFHLKICWTYKLKSGLDQSYILKTMY